MRIERWNSATDGPLTEQALRRKLEADGYRVTRCVYPPGTRFGWHTHEQDKKDAVLAGRFRISCEDGHWVLEAGDIVSVPCRVSHAAEVVGTEPVVSLDAVRDDGTQVVD
jgi:quercetin dioxygenase-like cupin family protein